MTTAFEERGLSEAGLDRAAPAWLRRLRAGRASSVAPPAEARERSQAAEAACAVWPTTALAGAAACAAPALTVWLAAALEGRARPVGLPSWVAEHALWGTALGALVAALMPLLARWRPRLGLAGQRRCLAGSLVLAMVAGLLLAGVLAAALGGSLSALAGLALAACLTALLVALRLARWGLLPRFDPIRVAVALAVATLPLTSAVSPQRFSLIEAWRVMLGG